MHTGCVESVISRNVNRTFYPPAMLDHGRFSGGSERCAWNVKVFVGRTLIDPLNRASEFTRVLSEPYSYLLCQLGSLPEAASRNNIGLTCCCSSGSEITFTWNDPGHSRAACTCARYERIHNTSMYARRR